MNSCVDRRRSRDLDEDTGARVLKAKLEVSTAEVEPSPNISESRSAVNGGHVGAHQSSHVPMPVTPFAGPTDQLMTAGLLATANTQQCSRTQCLQGYGNAHKAIDVPEIVSPHTAYTGQQSTFGVLVTKPTINEIAEESNTARGRSNSIKDINDVDDPQVSCTEKADAFHGTRNQVIVQSAPDNVISEAEKKQKNRDGSGKDVGIGEHDIVDQGYQQCSESLKVQVEHQEGVNVSMDTRDTNDGHSEEHSSHVEEAMEAKSVGDPCHLFKCVKDAFGRKSRICRATPACESNPYYFHRKDAIEKHLLKAHGIMTFIPGGFKLDDDEAQSVNELISRDETNDYEKRRTKNHFFNAERKYSRARWKFESGLPEKGLQLFNGIPGALRNLPQDEFIKNFCEMRMKEYDSKKDERMQKIHSRIAKGYEANRRSDGSMRKKDGSLHKKESSIVKSAETGSPMQLITQSTPVKCAKTTNTSPKETGLAPSQADDDNQLTGSVEVSYGHVYKRLNLQSGNICKRFQYSCRRLNLSFNCTYEFLSGLIALGKMADTMVFNLFTLWFEFMLPLSVSHGFWLVDPSWIQSVGMDKVNKIFTLVPPSVKIVFFPILYSEHWTLWTIVNFSDNGIDVLKGKEGMLYMDPLNKIPSPLLGQYVVEAVKVIWGSGGRDKLLLKNDTIPIPIPKQTNAVNSGFYVMYCIRMIVEECLQGVPSPGFGTECWFQQEDVDLLRMELSRWARRVVGAA